MSLERLKEFTKPYLELLPRVEMQRHGDAVMEGLLTEMERKSVEPIAEQVGQHRRTLQYFMGESPWDHQALVNQLCETVAKDIGDANGILVIDPSAFPKKGKKSVGVARQWCGRLGKKENCQVGVFLGYVTNKGHTLVDERLYLPREWTKDRRRKEICHVPASVRFKTAQKLALEMLENRRRELPHSWIVGDDEFGRGFPFRKELERMGEILRNPNVDIRSLARKITHRLRRNEQSRIDHWKKFNRLPPPWTIVRSNFVPNFAQ